MINNFAIFILTHGRPNNQKTLDALLLSGYTGEYYLVVDNLDKTKDDYIKKYGKKVIVFDKVEYVEKTDTGLITPMINFAVFARNAIETIAKNMGYKYFGMFDDDISKFRFRYEESGRLTSLSVQNMDEVLKTYIEYMRNGKIACVSFGVVTQYIGGINRFRQRVPDNNSLRMCFNAYIRDAD